ncbi:MAG: hypothetical protein IPN48_05350 [Sphingomonadales bacterium]|nr:hypothetical protein [Sphingomonadales bacterium]
MKAIGNQRPSEGSYCRGQTDEETLDGLALLNLEHTFGHALEAETGFSDRLLHGEKLLQPGMALAFAIPPAQLVVANRMERVSANLRAVGLPEGPAAAGVEAKGSTLVGHMLHDKKMTGGTPTLHPLCEVSAKPMS